jgi:hypothetical protein
VAGICGVNDGTSHFMIEKSKAISLMGLEGL